MRVLFVTNVFRSHLYALVPLAWALRTAGHDVRVAGPPDIAGDIVHTGLPGVLIGGELRIHEKMAQAVPFYDQMEPADPRGMRTGKSLQTDFGWGDPHAELADFIAGVRTALFPDDTIDDLVSVARAWRPDLVITDPTAFPGALAARTVGAAHARQLFGMDRIAQVRAACLARPGSGGDPLRDWLEPIMHRYGCAFDEEAVLGQWTVSPLPSFIPGVEGVHYVPARRVPFNGPSIVPRWLEEPPARRRVCMTLGVTHRDAGMSGISVQELLDAVADLDVEVVATFNAQQLASVSVVPDNVRVVDFVPLNALLPTCSAIVHEGGSGAFAGALENGVPQVIVPHDFTVEKWLGPLANAIGLEERGAGVYAANARSLTASVLRDSLKLVLEDPSFAAKAARLRTEALAMPTPNDIVPVLEKLTAEHRSPRS
ncbi:glycosyl transferase [Sphaerisporangium melleum]|uniref:Glycosyl transferase n=1 Tax=Sphaerisporangium melleum TaxID=321316 RepID=A0A917R5U0_9ACTN|nr:activator-dependent family glycosyltransferase [Sphaerisporangium melleum]GGK91355.1 glycosyl transferase [Sphaerisporangium melleum]GII72892.1 glycosyl transferase [Sphaerisporangium melleum]